MRQSNKIIPLLDTAKSCSLNDLNTKIDNLERIVTKNNTEIQIMKGMLEKIMVALNVEHKRIDYNDIKKRVDDDIRASLARRAKRQAKKEKYS